MADKVWEDMAQQYQTKTLGNYLVILCPKEALEGYQYRMLAVNHIPGLLPCSLRSIDADTYLYYDITSLQSLNRRYERSRISGQEMRRILYSITEMEKSLSKYLLDEKHLFMDPEYVYYDFEAEELRFAYYPEQRDDQSMHRLLEYLADKSDPQDAESTAVIYRLCGLSANAGFVLREELLDHEYEQAGVKETTGFRTQAAGPRKTAGEADLRYHCHYDAGEEDLFPEDQAERSEKGKSRYGGRKHFDDRHGIYMTEGAPHGDGGKVLMLAAVFLMAAAILGAAYWLMPLNETQKLASMAGMAACLVMTVAFVVYGTIESWKKSRNEEQLRAKKEEEERRNAMAPAVEYDACTKRK